MSTHVKRNNPSDLKTVKAILMDAVGRLDLRGTNQCVTAAMCIIEVTLDSSLRGKRITAGKALKLGQALTAQSHWE